MRFESYIFRVVMTVSLLLAAGWGISLAGILSSEPDDFTFLVSMGMTIGIVVGVAYFTVLVWRKQ